MHKYVLQFEVEELKRERDQKKRKVERAQSEQTRVDKMLLKSEKLYEHMRATLMSFEGWSLESRN